MTKNAVKEYKELAASIALILIHIFVSVYYFIGMVVPYFNLLLSEKSPLLNSTIMLLIVFLLQFGGTFTVYSMSNPIEIKETKNEKKEDIK